MHDIYSGNILFFYSVLKRTVVMNQPTNSIIRTMNSCKTIRLNLVLCWTDGPASSLTPPRPVLLLSPSGWWPEPRPDLLGGGGRRSGGSWSSWRLGWTAMLCRRWGAVSSWEITEVTILSGSSFILSISSCQK